MRVDHYLQQAFSFKRSYFYGDGKAKLPEEFVLRQQEVIGRIKLEASLIIAGFMPETDFALNIIEPRPFLCVVDDTRSSLGIDEVFIEREYDAIGSGAGTAMSMLFRREQDSVDSLVTTIYNVYEANCMSDKVPGVGRWVLNFDVLCADGSMRTLTENGYKYLRDKFKKFGPKKMEDKNLELKDEFLETFPEKPKPPQVP